MNNVTIAGQLGRDAEVRFLPNGDPVAKFSVADSQGKDSQGKDKETIWWTCQLFGKRAQSLAPYLLKGQSVTISGSITNIKQYTDKNGVQKISTDVRVNDVALQGGRKENSAPQQNANYVPKNQNNNSDNMDDDIPF